MFMSLIHLAQGCLFWQAAPFMVLSKSLYWSVTWSCFSQAMLGIENEALYTIPALVLSHCKQNITGRFSTALFPLAATKLRENVWDLHNRKNAKISMTKSCPEKAEDILTQRQSLAVFVCYLLTPHPQYSHVSGYCSCMHYMLHSDVIKTTAGTQAAKIGPLRNHHRWSIVSTQSSVEVSWGEGVPSPIANSHSWFVLVNDSYFLIRYLCSVHHPCLLHTIVDCSSSRAGKRMFHTFCCQNDPSCGQNDPSSYNLLNATLWAKPMQVYLYRYYPLILTLVI